MEGFACPEDVVNRPRGFTMIELMIVFVLIGIVLAASVPNFIRYRNSLMKGQSRSMLIEDLRAARQRAVTQHMPVIVAFGNGTGTTNLTYYSIHGDADGDRVVDNGEYWVKRMLNKSSKLSKVSLSPIDSLIIDSSGILRPGTMGGTIIVATGTALDTLAVTVAGTVYDQ